MKKYVTKALENNFSFNADEEAFLDDIDITEHRYDKGQHVYRVGDDVNYVFCVVEGWVTSSVELENGSRQLMNFHVPIDICGVEFISDSSANASMIAFKPTTIYRMPSHQVLSALKRSSIASIAILKATSRRYITLQERICVFSQGDARAKISHLLIGLRSKQIRNGFKDPDHLRLPLTQNDIADALGLTTVTVSRTFKFFKDKNIALFDRRQITILDVEKLKSFVSPFHLQSGIVDEFR